MRQILTFKNKPTASEFAPIYDYKIYENYLGNFLDVDFIAKTILSKEKKLLKKYPAYNDGNTGLGEHSLTSRYKYFNLLEWEETSFLKNIIKNCHSDFIINLGFKDKTIYAQCWANVLRKGEQIKRHRHSITGYSYLSGHICIATENTNTHYVTPNTGDIYSSKNIPGKITLFPSYIEHYTDIVENNQERITIAFDLYSEIGWKEDIIDDAKSHWIKL
jgi:hypothetical protein